METKQVNVFNFSELSTEAQHRVIEKFRHVNVEYTEWYESVYEWFKQGTASEYFDIGKIYFSGFWSQGDGAMFEYSRIHDKLRTEFIDGLNLSPMRKNWLLSTTNCSGSGKHSGHYYHEKSVKYSIYLESDFTYSAYPNIYNWIESLNEDFEDFVIEKYEDFAGELYRHLEREYDELTSNEFIVEFIEANDYQFLEDGTLSNF